MERNYTLDTIDTNVFRQIRDHLAARHAPEFDMAKTDKCIMYDVLAVLDKLPRSDHGYEQIGEALGLTEDNSWELFYAGSIGSLERNLESFTKDEALAVLDKIIEQGFVTWGVWRDTINHKTFMTYQE